MSEIKAYDFPKEITEDLEGEGLLFYRCYLCKGIISKWDIDEHHECRCGHTKLSPTNLTLWEKIVQIFKHPAIWKWSDA